MSPEIKQACSEITSNYQGYTTNELFTIFNFPNEAAKSVCYGLVNKMLTEKGFDKKTLAGNNVTVKTLVTNSSGGRTEDMKLFRIDFDEIQNANLKFADSSFYKYFSEKQFLFAIFKENFSAIDAYDSEFLGFKSMSFSEDYLFSEVYKTWNEIRDLVLNGKLENVGSAPNFPKSSTNKVFVRGGGANSKDKTEYINGIRMYKQYIWIRGRDIVSDLEKIPFIL